MRRLGTDGGPTMNAYSRRRRIGTGDHQLIAHDCPRCTGIRVGNLFSEINIAVDGQIRDHRALIAHGDATTQNLAADGIRLRGCHVARSRQSRNGCGGLYG